MAKVMIFIDGTWLYANVPRLCDAYGQQDFRVDFGKLPKVLAEEVGKQLGSPDVDVVRTHLFGSYAANFDWRDEESVERRRDFFDMLKEEFHYEVELFSINFMGRRLRKADRDPQDTFEPKEKCVDIALSTSMMYYAAIPNAYEIAVAVVGDRDFTPTLQCVRRLGKRVSIASIKGSCAPDFSDIRDEARVKDFDLIWLDDLLHRLELKYERHQLVCEAPGHRGNRQVWTTFHPRKGTKFFCEDCRREFIRQKQEMQREMARPAVEATTNLAANPVSNNGPAEPASAPSEDRLTGTVKSVIGHRGFGFIAASDGNDYFFHIDDLGSDLEFTEVLVGRAVDFEIKRHRQPDGRAGAAQRVRPLEA